MSDLHFRLQSLRVALADCFDEIGLVPCPAVASEFPDHFPFGIEGLGTPSLPFQSPTFRVDDVTTGGPWNIGAFALPRLPWQIAEPDHDR